LQGARNRAERRAQPRRVDAIGDAHVAVDDVSRQLRGQLQSEPRAAPLGKLKPCAATPTTAFVPPSTRTLVPRTSWRPPNIVCQARYDSTIASGPPGTCSSAMKPRPRASGTPKTWKNPSTTP